MDVNVAILAVVTIAEFFILTVFESPPIKERAKLALAIAIGPVIFNGGWVLWEYSTLWMNIPSSQYRDVLLACSISSYVVFLLLYRKHPMKFEEDKGGDPEVAVPQPQEKDYRALIAFSLLLITGIVAIFGLYQGLTVTDILALLAFFGTMDSAAVTYYFIGKSAEVAAKNGT